MTEAPEEIHIKPNRDYTAIWGRPVVTDPFDDDPETAGYIRLDIHDAAVSAARKEGMLEGLSAAKAIAEKSAENDWTDGVAAGWGIAEDIAIAMEELTQ